MTTRIDRKFAALAAEGRCGLVTFLMAGDPDPETSLAIISALPKAGADAVVVGSALVERVRSSLDAAGKATPDTVRAVTSLVAELATGVRDGRRQAAE